MTVIEKLAAHLGIDADAFEMPSITRQERTEAQALYTAIMTDTLIGEIEA